MAQHLVTIGWTPSTDAVQGYNVYRSANAPGQEAPPALNGAALITDNTYTDTVPSPGAYDYVVKSVENGAESLASNEVTALVLPFPPTNVTVGAIV